MTRRRPRGHGNGVRESPSPLLTVEIYVTVMAGREGFEPARFPLEQERHLKEPLVGRQPRASTWSTFRK